MKNRHDVGHIVCNTEHYCVRKISQENPPCVAPNDRKLERILANSAELMSDLRFETKSQGFRLHDIPVPGLNQVVFGGFGKLDFEHYGVRVFNFAKTCSMGMAR